MKAGFLHFSEFFFLSPPPLPPLIYPLPQTQVSLFIHLRAAIAAHPARPPAAARRGRRDAGDSKVRLGCPRFCYRTKKKRSALLGIAGGKRR